MRMMIATATPIAGGCCTDGSRGAEHQAQTGSVRDGIKSAAPNAKPGT